MKKLLISCQGFDLGRFTIPAFELYENELITLYLYNGAHLYDLSLKLIAIFTARTKQEAVMINSPLTYVKRFKENRLRHIFCPTTVEKYIKNECIENEDIIQKIYEIESERCLKARLEPNAKIENLEETAQKLLSLYAVLNHTNKIIFDLVGQSPNGALKMFQIVKNSVSNAGGAILLDGFEDETIKNESSKWLKIGIKE